MPTGAMLDDIRLPLVQDVRTWEDWAWVVHDIPGKEGGAHQDLGREPVLITVIGAMVDEESLAALEALRKKFQAHEPLPFVADIGTATEIQEVVIDDLQVTEKAGRPQQYGYILRLKEYLPPPPPVQPLSAPGVELDAEDIFSGVTDLLGELPGLGDLFDLDLVNPVPPMQTILDDFTSVADEISGSLAPLDDLLGS